MYARKGEQCEGEFQKGNLKYVFTKGILTSEIHILYKLNYL